MADVAARHLGQSYDSLATSVERLSSGLRINGAKDDAAGLAVRELIRADVATLRQGQRNAADAISMLQTAEGALGAVDDILVRMKELAEQASTGSYSDDQRDLMNQEFAELAKEISRIAETTDFNDIKLLNGTNSYEIHVGSTAGSAANKIDIGAEYMDAGTLQLSASSESAIWTEGGVTAETSNLITATGSGGGAISFSFADDLKDDGTTSMGSLDITIADSEQLTLDDVVNKINTASEAAQTGYTAASTHYDADLQKFFLKVDAYTTGDRTDLAVTTTGTLAGTLGDITASAQWATTDGDGTGAGIATQSGAKTALDTVDAAITTKDTFRAKLGYMMNRLEAASTVVGIQAENLAGAESRISDVDVATEMAAMTRNQVLAQAGISMLSQANSMPQMALSLLQ